MSDPVLLIIDMLAVFRLARLVTVDSLLDTPRAWLLRRWPGSETVFLASEVEVGDGTHWITGSNKQLVAVSDAEFVAALPSWFGKWLECAWCNSVAIAAGVVTLRQATGWWQWPALILALSAVAGIVHYYTYTE